MLSAALLIPQPGDSCFRLQAFKVCNRMVAELTSFVRLVCFLILVLLESTLLVELGKMAKSGVGEWQTFAEVLQTCSDRDRKGDIDFFFV